MYLRNPGSFISAVITIVAFFDGGHKTDFMSGSDQCNATGYDHAYCYWSKTQLPRDLTCYATWTPNGVEILLNTLHK